MLHLHARCYNTKCFQPASVSIWEKRRRSDLILKVKCFHILAKYECFCSTVWASADIFIASKCSKRFQWVTGLKSRHARLAPAAGMCAEHSLELLLK